MALRPRAIVNAAACTAVDKAEAEQALPQVVNAQAPAGLADAAQSIGAWLVHSSTDYVFSGMGETPWREDEACAPINAHAQTKWQGEKAIRATQVGHLIFRASWVYALTGGNFARIMVRLILQREHLQVVSDQVGAPTGAALIADVTAHALR
jgi:dTDP-4-dehydrorhamnose reductase